MPPILRHIILAAATLAVIAWVVSRGPMPQDQTYHRFADARTFAGIPHFMDTVTNLAFLAVGLWGCASIRRLRNSRDAFEDAAETVPYLVFFGGMCLIAAGSMYYHLDPRNWTLLWDRLAMTVSFMAFFAIVIGERLGARTGRIALPFLVMIGIAGAVYWYATERAGHGDMRIYVLVQFYPIVIIPLASLLLPGRYSKGWVFTLVIAVYAAAKLLEMHDAGILRATGGVISGHSLKHLVAAVAPLPLVWMLGNRVRPLP
ncbi:MAG: ceramidase domain-containing protein [Spirochaetes bacterium]|nr:ceramidase domain-containing protein [Spirochaetota bacterium]